MKIEIDSPIEIVIPRKTKESLKFRLNLNVYRNTHHMTLNKAKVAYNGAMRAKLEGLKFVTPIDLTFISWKPSKRRIDSSNILSIVEKFFCDALVEFECIPDDNDEYIRAKHYYVGGVDKDNPRVTVRIEEI